MSLRLATLAVAVLVGSLALAGCGEDTASDAPGAYTVQPAEATKLIEAGERMVIDVRTPAEYAEAHVAGAINIDVESDDFDAQVQELDPSESYLVYCRSGNRSAVAAEKMEAAGFDDIADAGGLADLARAGAPIE